MSTEQQASKSNNEENSSPPGLARSILSFFLPATLRDPILGDLEEEFAQRACSNSNLMEVHRWYWWQVLQSSCLFIWQQRGNVMAYLISVILFGLLFGLGVATTGYGLWFIVPPVLIATIPTSLILGIGATSIQAAKNAFKLSFSDSGEHSPQIVSMACRFLHVTGNQFLFVAGAVFFMGSIQWLFSFSQNPELMNDPSHYAGYGFAILPLFYGMIFKCLFYSAEQKLLGKYVQE